MRVTGPLIKILRALLDEPGTEIYGLQLLRATGLKSGTLYPILDRLEEMGWVKSRWENVDPVEQGRPRRRLYTFTGMGVTEARRVLVEHGATGGLVWA